MRDAPPHPLEQLLAAGIAPRRARRILCEFAQHHADVIAEQLDLGLAHAEAIETANTRLGTQDQLVADALRRPELKSWTRRRPAIAFALAPLLSLMAAFCASLLVFCVLIEWRKSHGDAVTRASPLIHGISEYGSAYLLWGLPLLASLLLALFARRRRERSWWPCLGILATSFLGSLTNFTFDFPPTAGAPSMGAGIGISTDNLAPVLFRTACSASFALAAYLWMRRTSQRPSGS